MAERRIERIIHFKPDELCKSGFVHFGFHDRTGNHYLLEHQKHFLGLIGSEDRLEWTVSREQVLSDVPNISAEIRFPMYIDSLPDDTLVVSNFGNSLLYNIIPSDRLAELIVDGKELGMKDMGNCVVDNEGYVWINEVTGNKIWRLSREGQVDLVLGKREAGFQKDQVSFDDARFSWIYDIRRGPDGNIYVLDSKNYAVRVIDLDDHIVRTIAGTGAPGYDGDGRMALSATFGSKQRGQV